MKLMIDTHVVLWWYERPEVLPATLIEKLESRENILLLSVAVPWELAIKTNGGKLDANRLLQELQAGSKWATFQVLPAELGHVIRAGRLPLHHRDPFDRLMAAQSLELGVPIVSHDTILDKYGVERLWA